MMTAIVIGLLFGAITTLLWYGAAGVAAGTITGGTIAAFVLTGGLVAGAFGALTEVYGDLLRAAGAAERLSELLNAEASIAPPAKPRAFPETPVGTLEFGMSNSTIRRAPTPRRSTISRSRSARARRSRSSAPRAPANRRSSSSPSASTTRRAAKSCSTASR
jgi:ABC-type multidrug transport system fused ATPase/permease subunit